MVRLRALSVLAAVLALAGPAGAATEVPTTADGIVTRIATRDKIVFLTFDACEAGKRARLDHGITDTLLARAIPFTVFVGGRFARDNAADLRELARNDFVDLENHTWDHPRDLRLLDDAAVREEVTRAADEIRRVTGRRTRLFRFPGGNADERTVALVEALGYRVVHWRWPEGDPVREITADQLVAQTLERTRPGDILIFHVNGRGWHTAEALPRVIDGLQAQGYRFARLPDYVPPR